MALPTPLTPPELGAVLRPDGSCLFRVWAPRAGRASVRFVGPESREVRLDPADHGYHAAVVPGVRHGDRYVFALDTGVVRPDPASRWQPDGVHAASAVLDPAFPWTDDDWADPDLNDYVVYELHVGTFTREGTFDAAVAELDRLRDLGVTAVELMPVAQFPGGRNWGYDGTYPFAVQHSYGGAAGLKRFVNACHVKGLAVVLDVVYNHLGPEGNYLREFGPYFTDQYKSPWGDAINFDGPGSDQVREYFLANALYWQHDFHIDALRLDAANTIRDFSAYPFLAELVDATRTRGRVTGRNFHLIAESDANDARFVTPTEYGGLGLDGMWADDLHHALHALLTGQRTGYFEDFGELDQLVRALRDGYTYSGQYAPHRGRRHGNSPAGLHPWQFVVCSQNHDQVGNQPRGERLGGLIGLEGKKLAAAVVLLSPYVPLLFMGEEYAETAPFQYFISHGDPDLVEAVRRGRREEFSQFHWGIDIPDPQAEATFGRSKLNTRLASSGPGAAVHAYYRKLISLRKEVPALRCGAGFPAEVIANERHRLLTVRRSAPGCDVVSLFHFGTAGADVRTVLPPGRWAKLVESSDPRWGGPGATTPDELDSPGEVDVRLAPLSCAAFVRGPFDGSRSEPEA